MNFRQETAVVIIGLKQGHILLSLEQIPFYQRIRLYITSDILVDREKRLRSCQHDDTVTQMTHRMAVLYKTYTRQFHLPFYTHQATVTIEEPQQTCNIAGCK